MTTTLLPGRGLRILYCIALLTLVPSMLFGAVGWIGLTTGGGLLALVGPVGSLAVAGLILLRIFMVIRSPAALAWPSVGWSHGACIIGIGMMTIGALAAAGLFFSGPLGHLLFGRTEAGVGIYVTGIFLYLGSNLAWLGVLVFETGRLCGRIVPDGEAGVRFAKWMRLARYGALVLIIAGTAYLYIIARSERQAFTAQCEKLPGPTVKEPASEVFDSVLIDDTALQPLKRGIFALETANIDQLNFVERCMGSPTFCQKIINSRTGNFARNDMQQTKEAVSRVMLSVQPAVVRSSGAGTMTYQLEYRMTDRRSGKTLASAHELVFDWGSLSMFRTLIYKNSTAPMEACGYALPEPHSADSGARTIGSRTQKAYFNAEKALILSVMPAK